MEKSNKNKVNQTGSVRVKNTQMEGLVVVRKMNIHDHKRKGKSRAHLES
jgi:hypothetical protein